MCAIYGYINTDVSAEWLFEQRTNALRRGKELTQSNLTNGQLFHTRLATNDSPDKYPIVFDNKSFAMNGIVAQSKYQKLIQQYGDVVAPYTVDSAFLLQEYLTNGFQALDSTDYVFAFWLIDGDDVILANKDFPLYVDTSNAALRFSSFIDNSLPALGNRAIKYNLRTREITELYTFKNMVYDT